MRKDPERYNEHNRNILLNISALESKLSSDGYVIMEDFYNLEDFKNFTDRIRIPFRRYLGSGIIRESRLNDDTLLNVNMPDDFGGSSLHGEQYYLVNPPCIVFFFCNRKAIAGGQTLLCDGITLLDRLPKDLRDKLINQNIIYKRTFSEYQWIITMNQCSEALRSWRYDINPDGTVSAEFRTKATWKLKNGNTVFINSILPMLFDFEKEGQTMEVIFEDGTIIDKTIGNIILDITNQLQTEIFLEENQSIAVDNRWILHGRKPFIGSREMFTRMTVADLQFNTT